MHTKRRLLKDRKKINKSNQDLTQHLVWSAANRCICAEIILKLWLFIICINSDVWWHTEPWQPCKGEAEAPWSITISNCLWGLTFARLYSMCTLTTGVNVCGEALFTREGFPCCTLLSMKMYKKYDKDQNSSDPARNLSADSQCAIKQI